MPLVKNHVIGNNAVLPTVCATAWMVMAAKSDKISTAEQALAESGAIRLRNYKLFKGLNLGGAEAPPSAVTLNYHCTDLSSSLAEVDNKAMQVKLFSHNENDKMVFHYQADIDFPVVTKADIFQSFNIQDENTQIDDSVIYSTMLFHTGCLRGVKRVLNYSDKHLTLQCRVNSADVNSFPEFADLLTNPLADDLALQALCIWPKIIMDYSALPSKFDDWTHLRPVPLDHDFYVTLKVIKSTNMQLTSMITVHDQQGQVYSQISGAVATTSENLNRFITMNKILHE